MNEKPTFIRQLEASNATTYYPPGMGNRVSQMLTWTGRLWLHWRGQDEGTFAVTRNEAQDWLRANGHLAYPPPRELEREKEEERIRFERAITKVLARYREGTVTRQEAIDQLIKETE